MLLFKNELTDRRLGANAIIDYTIQQPLGQALRAALVVPHGTPVLVDKVLDCVRAARSEEVTRLLAFDGVICPIISLAEQADAFSKSLVFTQLFLGTAHKGRRDCWTASAAETCSHWKNSD